MFLLLNHKKFDVYNVAGELLIECYRLTAQFPAEERYNLTQQIKRAALSVKLNIAEGASRKSSLERRRFYEIARGSVIELDAAIEVGFQLNYLSNNINNNLIGSLLNRCFSMLTKMTTNKE